MIVKAPPSSRVRFWLSAVATLAILVFGSIWIRNHWFSLIRVFELQPVHLAGMAMVTVVLIVVMSWMNQMAVIHLGGQMAFFQCLAVTLSSALMNLVLPLSAGLPFRATYIKKCANLSLPHFTSVLTGITLISIMVTTVVGLVIIPWTSMAAQSARLLACILAAVWAIALAVALMPVRPIPEKPASRWLAAIQKTQQGWAEIRQSKFLLIQIAVACLLQIGLLAGRLSLAYQAVGHGCSLPSALLLAVLASLSTLVSITPAGLGVREAALTVGEAASGGDPAVGLIAAMADRVVNTIVILMLGPIGLSIAVADLAKSERQLES